MKLYEINIRPTSGFGTALKGDTLFGHFCWQVWHKPSLVKGGLDARIDVYTKKPFVIFSSAFPKLNNSSKRYILKRPDLPLSFLFPGNDEALCRKRLKEEKSHRKKKWMVLADDLRIDLSNLCLLTEKEVSEKLIEEGFAVTQRKNKQRAPAEIAQTFSQSHNSINRITQTTGKEPFTPYGMENFYYYPEIELAIFVLIDELVTNADSVGEALEKIGQWGYGRDASVGLGRFKTGFCTEMPIPDDGIIAANSAYTLAPSVPEENCYLETYFTPFTRFGKHGDSYAHAENPFKNPIILADEGAVYRPSKHNILLEKPYIGKALTGVSKSMPKTVVQGYSPYLPLKLEY